MPSKKLFSDDYYEITPDGSLLLVPVVRSFIEVVKEREKVARYFEGGNEVKVLYGICDLLKMQLVLDKMGASHMENSISTSLKLQGQIDVYNHITADQMIKSYEASSSKG